MRVVIHFGVAAEGGAGGDGAEADAGAAPNMSLKMKFPGKWLKGPVKKSLDFFVESYNKKHPEHTLDADNVHFVTAAGKALPVEAITEEAFEDKEEVRVEVGAPPSLADYEAAEAKAKAEAEAESAAKAKAAADARKAGTAADPANAGKKRCRNYGCQSFFTDEENGDTACRHHSKPPLFHETKKGWTCCSDKTGMAYDWEGFMAIPGCTWGKHSTEEPAAMFAESPTLAMAGGSGGDGSGAAPAPLRTAEDFAEANKHLPTASKSMAKTLTSGPAVSEEAAADGRGKCANAGCGKEYDVDSNTDTACVYHRLGPVFHDAGKWWACCSHKKCWDFEEFMAVPGCARGRHRSAAEKKADEAAEAAAGGAPVESEA